MPVMILTKAHVSMNRTVVFDFGQPVFQYVVGISRWNVTYADNSSHYTNGLSLNILTSLNGTTVVATPHAELIGSDGSTMNPDYASSSVDLTCIAVVTEDDGNVFLTSVNGIRDGTDSPPIFTSGTPSINQGVVTGWNIFYGANHGIRRFHYGAGTSSHGASETVITGSAGMEDKSGNSAVGAAINGGLVCTNSSESGLVVSTYSGQKTGTIQVTMDEPISQVGVMIQKFDVSYGTGSYAMHTIFGGTKQATISQSNPKNVSLNNCNAAMNGTGVWSSDADSSATVLIFGIPIQQ